MGAANRRDTKQALKKAASAVKALAIANVDSSNSNELLVGANPQVMAQSACKPVVLGGVIGQVDESVQAQ